MKSRTTILFALLSVAASYTAQDELAQSRQNLTPGFVALYKALGGDWLDVYGPEDQHSRVIQESNKR